jgi:hypothetical protein
MMKTVYLSSLLSFSKNFRLILKDNIARSRKNRWDPELRLILAFGIDVSLKVTTNVWTMSGPLASRENLTIG